jgi:membrane protein involved in colicin uptake
MCLILLICVASVANAQEANKEAVSFVNTAIIRISTSIAEDEGRESAELQIRIKAEEEANEELKKATKARAKAAEELTGKIEVEQEARSQLEQTLLWRGQGITMTDTAMNNTMNNALDKLEKRVRARAAAAEIAETSAVAETTARGQLEAERAKRAQVEQVTKVRAQRRAQQSTVLETLKERWRANPTEDNLTDLSEKITAVATEQGVKANVKWKSTPTSGATIFYQTKRARERGDKPESIANPTETPQEIVIGRYYVWAERSGRATSDKERLIPIGEKTTNVTVVEDRQ